MGKSRQIKLDSRTFQKAGDATAFFSGMLNKYKIGERVSDEDCVDLSALIKRHEEASEKIGSGISYFSVESAPEPYSGKCFWIVRPDGSTIDISFKHCLEKRDYD